VLRIKLREKIQKEMSKKKLEYVSSSDDSSEYNTRKRCDKGKKKVLEKRKRVVSSSDLDSSSSESKRKMKKRIRGLEKNLRHRKEEQRESKSVWGRGKDMSSGYPRRNFKDWKICHELIEEARKEVENVDDRRTRKAINKVFDSHEKFIQGRALAEIIADKQGADNANAFRKGLQGGTDVIADFKDAYKYMEKFSSKKKKEYLPKKPFKNSGSYGGSSNGSYNGGGGKSPFLYTRRCHICKQEGHLKADCPNKDNK
jgi:hypothetical protein